MITNNKIVFRFLFIFFTLLIFPFPLSEIPIIGEIISEKLYDFYGFLIAPLAKSLMGIEELDLAQNGSGDKTFDYLLVLFFFIISSIITLLWSIIEKDEKSYSNLNYWFLTFLRFYLGSVMISYGMVKVIQLQFPSPGFFRLLEPYGDSSPMGLAWTFLGYSKGYNLFMGFSEVVGGCLLFHRRTSLLGALMLIGVSVNIVAINFCFDVPVKLFSTTLLIIAIIIAAPRFRQLLDVMLLNKKTTPVSFEEPIKSKRGLLINNILQWVFVAYILVFNFNDALESDKEYGENATKPELYGLYETTNFASNGDTLTPLLTDTTRWRYVSIEHANYITLYNMDMSRIWYKLNTDTLSQELTVSSFSDSTQNYILDYIKTDTTLNLNGVFKGDTIQYSSKILTKDDFLLTNRKFNWVNEYPYNR